MSSSFKKPKEFYTNFEKVSAFCHNGDGEIPSMETTMIETKSKNTLLNAKNLKKEGKINALINFFLKLNSGEETNPDAKVQRKPTHKRNLSDAKKYSTAKKNSSNIYSDRDEVPWTSSLRKNISERENILKKISNSSRHTHETSSIRSPPSAIFDQPAPARKVLEQSSIINLSKRDSQNMSSSEAKILVQKLFKYDKEFSEKVQEEARKRYLEEEKKACTFSPYINTNVSMKRLDGETVFERLNTLKKSSSKECLYERRDCSNPGKPFTPKINKRSKSLARINNQSIDKEGANYNFGQRLYGIPSQALFKEVWENINHNLADQNDIEGPQFFSPSKDKKDSAEFFYRKYVDKDENLSFTPKINESSKKMQRNYMALYEDAQRRVRKQSLSLERKNSILSNSFEGHPFHIENTKNLRVNRLTREFKACMLKYFPKGNMSNIRILRDSLGSILHDMDFLVKIKENSEEMLSKVWSLLVQEPDGKIFAIDLMNFLLVTMKLPALNKKSNLFEEFIQENAPASSNRLTEHDVVADTKHQTATFERHSQLEEDHESGEKSSKKMLNAASPNFKVFDSNKIQKAFSELYYTKLSYMKKEALNYEKFTFQPEISQTSALLAQQERKKITCEVEGPTVAVNVCMKVEDIMEYKREKSAERLLLSKKQVEAMRLSGCTFKPKINSQNTKTPEKQSAGKRKKCERTLELYNRGISKNKNRLNKDQKEIDYEKNAHECIFSPNVGKNRLVTPKKKDVVSKEAIDKSVERMNKAREEKILKELLMKKGTTFNQRAFGKLVAKKLPKQKFLNNANAVCQTFFQPDKSLIKEESDIQNESELSVSDENVLLFIDVTLRNGKKKKIIVKEGEEISEVVSVFGKNNGLDEETMNKLNVMLDQQLDLLLTNQEE